MNERAQKFTMKRISRSHFSFIFKIEFVIMLKSCQGIPARSLCKMKEKIEIRFSL
jgi:hypothetical protein